MQSPLRDTPGGGSGAVSGRPHVLSTPWFSGGKQVLFHSPFPQEDGLLLLRFPQCLAGNTPEVEEKRNCGVLSSLSLIQNSGLAPLDCKLLGTVTRVQGLSSS